MKEAKPLIDQCLLLLRFRLKDIDQGHQITLSGNEHCFSPLDVLLVNTSRAHACLFHRLESQSAEATSAARVLTEPRSTRCHQDRAGQTT